MNRQNALLGTIATGGISAAAGVLAAVSVIPLPIAELLLIVAFPLFVIFLGLFWSAKGGEEDIPFIGY